MSNLLSQASLVMIPSGYKEDVVYSQIPTNGNGDLSFTRASNGTRVNSAGLVEVVAWNLMPWSETFNFATGGWNLQNGATTVANSGTAPNGTNTATLLYPSVNGVIVAPNRQAQPATAPDTAIYTQYVYAKASGKNWVALYTFNGTSGTAAWFNLSTGVVGTVRSGCTAFIESAGNGWYKCGFSESVTSGASLFMHIYPTDGDNTITATTSGTNGILIWGAQANIGATAKPYFPTTDRLNVPRLTYQNGGGGCPSLLLEKQSTNYAIYSEDLTQSATSFSGGTVGANVTTSPDGTQNADSFTVNTATSSHAGYYETYNATNGQPFTTSVFLKAGTGRYFLLRAMTDNYATRYGATIDLQSGTILSTNTLGSPTGTSSKIENFGNGWYRVSLTINAIGSQMSYIWGTSNTATPSLDAYLDYSYTGNGTDSYYIWGMTLENSSYPTSYIPTTSSSATRVADACSKTGISSLIGQTEGTLFADVIYDASILSLSGGSDQPIIAISDGTFQNYIAVLLQGSNDNRVISYCVTSGSTQAFIVSSAQTSGTIKIAVSYKSNYFALFVNGVKLGQDTSISIPATNSLNIGSYFSTASQFSTTLKETAIWKVQLTDAECIALTT